MKTKQKTTTTRITWNELTRERPGDIRRRILAGETFVVTRYNLDEAVICKKEKE